jgi:hypothetical protein
MGLFLSRRHFWFFRFFVRSRKAVLRPVAWDQVRGARGRGQGTETVAQLGGLPPSGACVSQRLEAGARGATMNCETGFLHSLGVWSVPVCLLRIRGELAIGGIFRAAHLYTVGSLDPDHDAVMRIGGEAPGGGPILSVGIKCQVRIRFPATSDRPFGSRAESQRERRKWC